MKFEQVLSALKDGKSIRRAVWDKSTRLYFDYDNDLLCESNSGPIAYQLSGYEIMADDWEIARVDGE